jgi:hypothetical protein
MSDTNENQQDYPQHVGQKEGCGFPLASFVAAACLATGVILNAAIGTFSCHDLTLFYHIRDCLVSGDIFLADRGFCAYMELALFQERGVDSVVRLHASRHKNEFRNGKVSAAVSDRTVIWNRPAKKPEGLRREDYARLPDTLKIREITYMVTVPGFRTKKVTIATTLLDSDNYPVADISFLYFQRWQIEINFRHLKTTMQMDVLRGKSPEVVKNEFWAHILAYNLTRRLMNKSGERYKVEALRLSFKGAIQHMLIWWSIPGSNNRRNPKAANLLFLISREILPDHSFRVEPRVIKRRPKDYPLMVKPRSIYKEALLAQNG